MEGGLSIAIITYNEEGRLADCLDSLSMASEIVIVDSFSTDQTVKIAKSYGAKVFTEEWHGFGHQKQLAIDRCSNKWIMILDADERLTSKTALEIKKAFADPKDFKAFQLPRKNFFLNRWIRHAGWWPDYVTRLINKDYCKMDKSLVHESIIVNGKTGTINSPIIHHATKNLEHTMEKMNRYSSAGACEMFKEQKTASLGKALSRGAWAFFYNYFIRLGFLDGGPGFIIAVSDGINKFFKYAKLAEKNKGNYRL